MYSEEQLYKGALNAICYIVGCGLMTYAFGWTVGIGIACIALFLKEG